MQCQAYREACKQLEPECTLARTLIEARMHAGLTQELLARDCARKSTPEYAPYPGESRFTASAL